MSRSALGRVGLKLIAVGLAAAGLPLTLAATATATATATVAPKALPNATTSVQPYLSVVASQKSLAGLPGAAGPVPLGQTPIATFKWVLQEDTTGDAHQYPDTSHPETLPAAQQPSATHLDLCHPIIPAGNPNPYPYGNPNFPTGCTWPSIHYTRTAPVVTSGDQSDWGLARTISGFGPTDVMGRPCGQTGSNPASAVDCAGLPPATRITQNLPTGKYIVSVMADGFEIGGTRFTIPMTTDDTVRVQLNPGPIPLGTIKALAFADMAPTGGAFAAETDAVLSGFTAHISDFTDEVTQDYYGNALCTTYMKNTAGKTILDQYGQPTVDHLGGPNGCVTGADGVVDIPNLASGRYAVTLVPPDRTWIETTTLEGAHDFDVWMQASDTGLDTELVVAGEPVPYVQFGFAQVSNNPCPGLSCGNALWADPANQLAHPKLYGEITGRIVAAEPYVPGIGGIAGVGGANGQAGIRIDSRPIKDAYIALADLNDGDQTKYVQAVSLNPEPGKLDAKDPVIGSFDIKGIPNGSYLMAIWDYNQDYAFDSFQVDVVNGEIVRLGNTPLIGWFTRIDGHVFVDKNANGKMDPGEQGVPDFVMQILNRTNQQYEQGQNVAVTNDAGEYTFKEGYPLGQFNVLQFFNTRYLTTGTTCQADNDPQEHTTLTPAVDLSTLNIIGLNGRCDIGIQPYSDNPADNANGGIVSTVTYQSFRTVLQSNLNVNNAYDVGIPDFLLDLTQATACSETDPTLIATRCKNGFELDPAHQNRYLKHPIDQATIDASGANVFYTSEHSSRPQSGCTPRTADGTILGFSYQEALQPGGECVESAMQGTAFGFASDNLPLSTDRTAANAGCLVGAGSVDPLTGHLSGPNVSPGGQYVGPPFDPNLCALHGVQTVDGNYGFAVPGPGDYLVHVDMRTPAMVDMFGKPKFKVSTEANVNQNDGPMWVPQDADYSSVKFGNAYNTGVAPLANGPLEQNPHTYANAPHGQCAGIQYHVNNTHPLLPDYVANPSFTAALPGGGPFEGEVQQRCDTLLLHVQNGQSIAPNFFFYTDVPLATVFTGYAVDDISVSTEKKSTGLGEVQGIGNLPIGVYDWTGRQIDEVDSDPNGNWEIVTPSTNTFNCRSASGACVSVYRFIGNDPGQPARPNLNWNPAYRTIAATFQAWPQNFMPADVAPWRVVPSFEGNGSQYGVAVVCGAKADQPQMFNISKPYLNSAGLAGATRSGTGTRTSGSNVFMATTPSFNFRAGDVGYTLTVTGTGIPANTTIESVVTNKQVILSANATSSGSSSFTVTPSYVIKGLGFGSTTGTIQLTGVDGLANIALNTFVASWSDTRIVLRSMTSLPPRGQYQLLIRHAAVLNVAKEATNTVTFHVLGSGYNANVLEVGPGRTFDPNDPNFGPNPPSRSVGSIAVFRNVGLLFGPPGSFLASDVGAAVSITAPAPLTGALPAATTVVSVVNLGFLGSVAVTSNPVSFVGGAVIRTGLTVLVQPPPRLPGDGFVKGAIQRALEAAAANVAASSNSQNLVVVYPNVGTDGLSPQAWTPLSAYFENIIVHSPVRLQGTGPGGLYKDANNVTQAVPGAVIDGRFLNSNSTQAATNNDNIPGNEPYLFDWLQLVGGITHTNSALEVEGQVVYVIGTPNLYRTTFRPSIDGFQITGGDQKNVPGFINEKAPADAQGGGITLLADARNFRLGNNLVQWNSGTYGGAIRSGTPQVENDLAAGTISDAGNYNLDIHHNRIFANGGTNFAGAIALFHGSNGYRIHDNVICGNLSAEYGAGISHYGLSPNGVIDHNKIMLNQAIDEGGGVQIAGETKLDPALGTPNTNLLSDGAGPVSIHDNYIGDNLAQDDGGGVRFLMAGNWQFDVFNNMITNNMSAHEGGGIAIDDASNVRVYNNTIAKNITTATAVTSDGQPAPAGLSTGRQSTQLLACNLGNPNYLTDCSGQPPQPASPPAYNRPIVFNNIFWDNRAGTWDGAHSTVTGIGLPLDTHHINVWDLGVTNGASAGCVGTCINPKHNTFTSPASVAKLDGGADLTNYVGPDPLIADPVLGKPANTLGFVNSYDTIVSINPWRIQPRFRPTSLVTLDLPANVLGDYHLATSGSPAVSRGVANVAVSRVVNDGVTHGTGTLANRSTVTSATASFAVADIGVAISGTNIPAGTTIATRVNATTVTISNPATGPGTANNVTLTIANTNAPSTDIDADVRPTLPARWDAGADQVVTAGLSPTNIYRIFDGGGLTPLGSAAATSGALTGQLLSDPSLSPVQFATNGTANEAGNTAVLIIPGRPLNTKVTNTSAGLVLSTNGLAVAGNLVIEGAKTSSGAIEPAAIAGGANGGGQFKIQPRGAPPSVVPTPHSSSASSLFTSMPAGASAVGLLALALGWTRRRRRLHASIANGGHDVVS